jgi:hypothetical protein
MKLFLDKHAEKICATLSCFDRVLFKGYLPLSYAHGMQNFLDRRGILYKNFKPFVLSQAQRLRAHAEATAQNTSRPFMYLNGYVRKEALVQEVLKNHPVSSGLVCILSAIEPCQSFVLRYGEGRPQLQAAPRRCLCLYYYFLDPTLGLLHVRIQTWFPFTIQICVNGHEWLARHHIGHQKLDNAFLHLDDPQRAQRFADSFVNQNWPRILTALARAVNPLMGDLLRDLSYYWVVDQAEFATDIIFPDRAALAPLYEKLLRHATLCLSAEDILTFLGRKLHGAFQGEVLTDYKNLPRLPGARVKHVMTRNSIKMYDKFGHVLRIETVINRPREFRVRRRRRTPDGTTTVRWVPLTKGVAHLFRYQQVAFAANRRYLDALAAVEDPSAAYGLLDEVCHPATYRGRRRRALNVLRQDDLNLFAAVLRGEHAVNGFRNADLVRSLFPATLLRCNPDQRAKARARVSRLIQLLRARHLVAHIPRSHRYRVTSRGTQLMGAALWLRIQDFPDLYHKLAA